MVFVLNAIVASNKMILLLSEANLTLLSVPAQYQKISRLKHWYVPRQGVVMGMASMTM